MALTAWGSLGPLLKGSLVLLASQEGLSLSPAPSRVSTFALLTIIVLTIGQTESLSFVFNNLELSQLSPSLPVKFLFFQVPLALHWKLSLLIWQAMKRTYQVFCPCQELLTRHVTSLYCMLGMS